MNRPMDRSFGSDGWEFMVDKVTDFCLQWTCGISPRNTFNWSHEKELQYLTQRGCRGQTNTVWEQANTLSFCHHENWDIRYREFYLLWMCHVCYLFLSDWLMRRCFKLFFLQLRFHWPIFELNGTSHGCGRYLSLLEKLVPMTSNRVNGW